MKLAHWVIYTTSKSTCLSQTSLWLPSFLKPRTFIPNTPSEVYLRTCVGLQPPNQANSERHGDFFLETMRIFLAHHFACGTGKPDSELSYSSTCGFAFTVGCSVLCWSQIHSEEHRSLLVVLKVHFQLGGQRMLPVYNHEIDSHCLKSLEQERTILGELIHPFYLSGEKIKAQRD